MAMNNFDLRNKKKKKEKQRFDSFSAMKVSLASPDTIRAWSRGEVKKSETINYKSYKPEKDGLCDEAIFGPVKDYECACGKYKKIRYAGITCEKCGVTVTKAKVRREWMGHIDLAIPVTHIWYVRGVPSKISLLLNITPKDVEKVVNFSGYIILDPGDTGIEKYTVIGEEDKEELEMEDPNFKVGTGAEVVEKLLKEINLEKTADTLKKQIKKNTCTAILKHSEKLSDIVKDDVNNIFLKAMENVPETTRKRASSGTGTPSTIFSKLAEKHINAISDAINTYYYENRENFSEAVLKYVENNTEDIFKRLNVVESFINSGSRPEYMILKVLPVIPPELRPMVQLDGGRFATADLNDLYRRIINRNNRLKKLLQSNAPEIILKNEKRLLQSAVDALIDNGKNGKPVEGTGGRPYKSLTELLKGKTGRFRQNLLGKRVDFSGRSVIVVGPDLKFYQCGLPKDMAIELFRPFILAELMKDDKIPQLRFAKELIDMKDQSVYDALEKVIKDKTVLLNRAPTLHRLGIQAFEPVLVEGHAIRLHPLVCTAFNADFDGDQMAVHVPLSIEAQAEARHIMLSTNNILAPKDGQPIVTPTQDMILGCYYLTKGFNEKFDKKKVKRFTSFDEMMLALNDNKVKISDVVGVKVFADEKDKKGQIVYSTVGLFIFNKDIPKDLGYIDRKKDKYALEISFQCGKKQLSDIVKRCFVKHGSKKTSEVLDNIKALGFHYSSISSVTVGFSDMQVPPQKKEILKQAETETKKIEESYDEGEITMENRDDNLDNIWKKATDKIGDILMEDLKKSSNNIFIMADSGARGSRQQITQVSGIRGLMAAAELGNAAIKNEVSKGEDTDEENSIEQRVIKSSFIEGLSVQDFFNGSKGTRKGLTDTALNTAQSGYLTRRLVDTVHDIVVSEEDCGSDEFIEVKQIMSDGNLLETLEERIIGRTSFEDIKDKKGNVIVKKNEIISETKAKQVVENTDIVKIRSPLTCKAKNGVCIACYGRNLATGRNVEIGDAIGVIAAQSLGEPSTQLTLRTFHTGGVAGEQDITTGLPRVVELFEARDPRNAAVLSPYDGTVEKIIVGKVGERKIIILDDVTKKPFELSIQSVYKNTFLFKEGDKVKKGEKLFNGPVSPQELMAYKGPKDVSEFLIAEIQKTYRSNGIDFNDRHIEIIASRMLSKWEVFDPGDTSFYPRGLYNRDEIEKVNDALPKNSKKALYRQKLLGIAKVAVSSGSFLSAASFQETTRVLTDAIIKGKVDYFEGLKENVIVGRLIPAGTGFNAYKDLDIDYKKNESYIEQAKKQLDEEREAEKAGITELKEAEKETEKDA